MARRSAAEAAETREAIVAVACERFATDGFAATSLDAIAAAAGVTRGAVHHHFTDKRALFEEVFTRLEVELDRSVRRAAAAVEPARQMRAGVEALFAFFSRPDYRQVAIADAPAVLGLARWYEIDRGIGMTTMRAGVQALADLGLLDADLVEPVTVLLFGALTEAALVVGAGLAEVPVDRMVDAFERLVAGLAAPAIPTPARGAR